MVFGGKRILNIIELTTEYDISTTSNTTLRTKTEIITERPNNNLTTIFKDRTLNSELSNIPESFKSITVNDNDNNNIKKS